MTGFRLLLAGAALVVFGSLSASALPAAGGRLAIEADRMSTVIPARTSRSARCFRRCIAGGRRSCRYADSVEACCSARCRH